MENKYIIDEKQLQAILNYLSQKPWFEVKGFIDYLSDLQKVDDNNKEQGALKNIK